MPPIIMARRVTCRWRWSDQPDRFKHIVDQHNVTFKEVAASLPNGFHDAELQRFEMDYVHRTLRFDLLVWIGNMDDSRRR
jgi:hypothetical protein